MNGLIRRFQQHLFMRSNRLLVRSCSTSTSAGNNKEKFLYDDLIRSRQAEAVRSIVVQVNSENSFPELYDYCSDFGTIIKAQHYRIFHDDDAHYILLEFSSADEAAAAINSSSYNEEQQSTPVRSPFLWFKAARRKSKKELKANEKRLPPSTVLSVVDGTRSLDNNGLNKLLSSASCIEEQIKLLYEGTQLNDLGVRLRFLAALQVQSAVSGMFPEANAQPFGSSVNGFGKMGCDLDLILRFDREQVGEASLRRQESRLIFHGKENLANGRSQIQRQMESLGDILQLFLPGACHVRRILQARVPIIKYHHEHLNLEVDLSMSNLTGFYMSELLYMFGQLDDRVRPLTFTIRRWAQTCGLTNPSPGRWITNFSLTCLVIFFLQQLKQPILPPINALMKSAQRDDIRITEDGVNCTFGRSFERIGFQSTNNSDISELLLQFFEFCSQFDFHNRAISLNEGRAVTKPDHSALYIINPLEQVLNVSKNVSPEECERLRIEVRNAAWVLESEVENSTLPETADKQETPWGILNIFKTPEQAVIKPNLFFRPRMVEINELFDDAKNTAADSLPARGGGEKTQSTKSNTMPAVQSSGTSPTNTPTEASTPTTFKNDSVRQAVKNIKSRASMDLKQMRANAQSSARMEGSKSRNR